MAVRQGISKNEVLKDVTHFPKNRDHFERTFTKTALAWANENDDPISASDLLHLEYQCHTSKSEGLSCIKKQLTNDKLLYWITRTYSKFYPKQKCFTFLAALLASCTQLGLSYGFFVFDIHSDYQLTTEYWNAYLDVTNYRQQMLGCARQGGVGNMTEKESSCFQLADRYPARTYQVAYWLTWITMAISITVYIISIVIFFDTRNITQRFSWLYADKKDGKNAFLKSVCRVLIACLVRLFWPVFHVIRRIKYEASVNRASRKEKMIEFESIWIMVKSIEHGIETTIQMLIVLYLLVPYYDQIHNWDFQMTVKKTFNGIAYFASFGHYNQACLLEKVLGKLAINIFVQSYSLTLLKYMKYGMSVFEQIANMVTLLASNFLQIVARILVLRVFFVTAEDLFRLQSKGWSIAIFFILHFTFTFIIKACFEIKRNEFSPMLKFNRATMRFLINWISSSMLYIWSTGYSTEPRQHVHEHNTFLPQVKDSALHCPA